MLYRSTDRLCRRGAPMQNLAHSASFDSDDKDAPSIPGIKQLERFIVSRKRRTALSLCSDAIPDGKPLHTFPGIALARCLQHTRGLGGDRRVERLPVAQET